MAEVIQTILETEYRKHRIIIHCAPGGAMMTLLPLDGTHRLTPAPWGWQYRGDFTKLAFAHMRSFVDKALDWPVERQKLYYVSPAELDAIRRSCADLPAHAITTYGAATHYKDHKLIKWGLVSIDTNVPLAKGCDKPIDFPEGFFRNVAEDEMENMPPISQPLAQHLN